jgi:hypothetical protein
VVGENRSTRQAMSEATDQIERGVPGLSPGGMSRRQFLGSLPFAATAFALRPSLTIEKPLKRSHILVFYDWSLSPLVSRDHDSAQKLMDHPNAFVLSVLFAAPTHPDQKPTYIPPDWQATPAVQFASYAVFEQSVGLLAPDVEAVAYNNERWSYTPDQEQAHPRRFGRLFHGLATDHQLVTLAAPSPDLLRGRDRDERFTKQVLAPAARWTDMLDMQFQRTEKTPDLYISITEAAATKCREVNSNVRLLAQISTSAANEASLDQIAECIRRVAPVVDGFWFIFGSESGETNIALLGRLASMADW